MPITSQEIFNQNIEIAKPNALVETEMLDHAMKHFSSIVTDFQRAAASAGSYPIHLFNSLIYGTDKLIFEKVEMRTYKIAAYDDATMHRAIVGVNETNVTDWAPGTEDDGSSYFRRDIDLYRTFNPLKKPAFTDGCSYTENHRVLLAHISQSSDSSLRATIYFNTANAWKNSSDITTKEMIPAIKSLIKIIADHVPEPKWTENFEKSFEFRNNKIYRIPAADI